jgi:translocation and assembly module TamB
VAEIRRRPYPTEPEPSGQEPEATGQGEARMIRRRRRSLRRRAANTAGRSVAAVAITAILLLSLLVIVLQTQWGRDQLRRIALGELRELLAEHAELDVRRIEGNPLTGMRLLDVQIREGGDVVVEADTLALRYNIFTVLRQTFSASLIDARGLRVWAREDAEGSWNVGRILKPAPDRPDDRPTPWQIRLDELYLRRGAVAVHFYNPARDSVLIASPVEFDASSFFWSIEEFQVDLDTLAMNVLPAVPDPVTVGLATSTTIADERAEIRSLWLLSVRSDIRGTGVLDWRDRFTYDADLVGRPFALADLRQFVNVPLYGTADVDFRGRGTTEGIESSITADFRGHGSFQLSGTAAWPEDRPLRYDVEGTLTDFDLGQFLDSPGLASRLTGDLAVDLAGTQPETLTGDAFVRLRGSEIQGQALQRVVFEGRFDEGRVRFQLDGALPGAAVVATGTARPFDDVPTYDVTGTVRDLDLAALTGDPEQDIRVASAEFRIAGRGTDLETMAAEGRINATGVHVAGLDITEGRVTGDLTGGRLRYDGAVTFAGDGGFLAAAGTLRPFDEPLVYNVERGEVRNLNLATLFDNPNLQSDLTGTFSVSGIGTDPETLAAEFSVRLRDSQYGEYVVNAVDATGTLRQGLLTFDAAADLGEAGSLTAAGTLRPFADPLNYDVSGTATNLNLAALLQDPDYNSNLTGTFSMAGTGTDLETFAGDYSVSLRNSRFGDFAVQALDATGALRQGLLTFDAATDLGPDGSLVATGTMRPFDDPLTYDVTGRATNLNLAALLQDPAHDSDLTGGFAIAGTGTDPETLAANIRLELTAPSRYRQQQILAGALRGRLAAGRLDAHVDIAIPGGHIVGDIVTRPFDDALTISLRNASFAGVNLGALLGDPDLQTRLSGRVVELEWTGRDPATAVARGVVVLDPSRINRVEVLGGRIAFRLDRGFVDADAQLAFAEGDADFTVRGRLFDDVPTYDAEGRLTQVDIAGLLGDRRGPSRVSLTFEISGAGFDPETLTARARVRADDTRIPDGQIDRLEADLFMSDGLLTVHEFILEADFADARAEGQIALFDETAVSDLTFTADIRDARPIAAFIDDFTLEAATITGRATGPAGGPVAIDANAILYRATYGRFGTNRLDLRVNAEYLPGADVPFEGRVRARFDFISTPTTNLRSGDVMITYLDDQLHAEGNVTIDDFRDVTFNATFEQVDDALFGPSASVQLTSLDLQIGDEHWELLQPATIVIGADRYVVRNFLLTSNGQQIAADGVIDLRGEQTLVVTAENVDVEPFTDLIGYEGVGGVLTTTLSLLGTAAAPIVEGTARIDDITVRGEPVGALDATYAYADQRLDVDAVLAHVEGQTLEARGFLPLTFRLDQGELALPSDAPVEFTIQAEEFPIEWAEPFLPPRMFEEIGGSLTADVTVGGTQADPTLAGLATITGGRLQLDATGDARFEDINLALDFQGNEVRITSAQIRDGRGGTLTAEGSITLPRLSVGELDLHLRMQNFRVIDTPTYRRLVFTTTPAQRLRFSGTLTDPVLTGDVTLASGDIYLTEELMGPDLEDVELTAAQIQRLETTFGIQIATADTARATFLDQLSLDVGVEVERNVWLRSRRNPRFDIEFTGAADVVKPPEAEFQLFGSLEVIRGRIELPTLAGRSFDIGRVEGTHGSIEFNGPIEEAIVDVQAGLRAFAPLARGTTGATVYVGFVGRLAEDPELILTSDPQMDTADIACVIATGRPCGEAFQGGIAEDIALPQLGALVQGITREGLGLDVVEIEQRPTGEIVITFGAYVADRVFAAVSQPITEPRTAVDQTVTMAPEFTIEYELLRWLQLRLERRNIGGTGGTAIFQFDY